ncbi:phage tail sheath family protein [Streptomyces sp. NPDC004779]
MPQTFLHPGVYIQEVPGGSRAITGVATAITAFVGRALRGPLGEPVSVSSFTEFERVFGGLWKDSGLSYAIRDYFLNGGGTALVVRVGERALPATLTHEGVALEAVSPGEWGDKLRVRVTHPTDEQAKDIAEAQGLPEDTLFFHLTVIDDGTGLEETFHNVTRTDGPRRLDLALNSSQLIRATGGLPASGRPGPHDPDDEGQRFVASGDDGTALTAQSYKDGIQVLDQADLFTLMCLPPSAPGGDVPTGAEVWADALAYCAKRRAFLLVDLPRAETTAVKIDTWLRGEGLKGLVARNAAVYFPRIRRPDPFRDGVVGAFVPSGAVAGVMARTDVSRGVWKAPAGVDSAITGASGLAVTLTDTDQDAFNPAGINCLRTFRDAGSVVWGARTLRGAEALADEYKYVPVRRFALFLEESLFRGTQWVVFEPNDEPLWAQIRMSLGAFMQDLFRQGAFQGATPRDAYFVRCDAETNTPYDVDRGIVNIHVGFAPLRPAEFVSLSIQQKTAGAAV